MKILNDEEFSIAARLRAEGRTEGEINRELTTRRYVLAARQMNDETQVRIDAKANVAEMRAKGWPDAAIRAVLERMGMPDLCILESPEDRARFRIFRRRLEGAGDNKIRNELIARGLPTDELDNVLQESHS